MLDLPVHAFEVVVVLGINLAVERLHKHTCSICGANAAYLRNILHNK